MMLSRRFATALSLVAAAILALGVGASPAAAETHPFLGPLGGISSPDTFTNPNGIAVDESTGDVYVADLGSSTVSQSVSKFNSSGVLIESWGTKGQLTGTPTVPFSFPETPGTPAEIAVDNACVRHTPALSGVECSQFDPNAGDLYVLDAGHGVIDRFDAKGEYAGQIPGAGVFVLGSNGEVQGENPGAQGDAAGPTGDIYLMINNPMVYENCDCVSKYGGRLDGKLSGYGYPLGQVDSGPGDVAVAVDPATGHLYVDGQSSVAEWDTGAMNGRLYRLSSARSVIPTGTLVSSFSALGLSGVSGQGGIAVNGTNGDIYVSSPGLSPGEGRVYVFASTPPAVAAGEAANVSETGATLEGSVDPRGVPVSSCEFEYEKVSEYSGALAKPVTVFTHSAPCAQSAEQISSGTSPVAVSADIGGLEPLEPGALYDFRVAAGNANGTGASEGLFVTDTSFGVKHFEVQFLNQNGTQDIQAGSHPYAMVTHISFNEKPERETAFWDSQYERAPFGKVEDIIIDLPPGLVGDPNATETKCTLREIDLGGKGGSGQRGEGCSLGAEVGELQSISSVGYGNTESYWYNMVPPNGVAAQLGAIPYGGTKAYIDIGLKTGGQYPLQAESIAIPAVEPLTGLNTVIFGVVGGAGHRKPFLTLPTGCTGPMESSISVDSYEERGHYVSKSYTSHERLTGCSQLTFPPKITVVPDVSDASTPSGLTVGVHVPQTAALNPEGLAESALRDTTVALPEGVAINPAGADGLEACSEALAGFGVMEEGKRVEFTEFNPEFEPGVKTARFTPTPIEGLQPGVSFCPNSSKIGEVTVTTPLLPKGQTLKGFVYLAAQDENPFGSLIAMYMMVEDPVSGSTIKLAGEVLLCESTGQVLNGVSCQAPGQVVTTFKNTPDLPFEDLELHFFGGERAPLRTPSRCGTYTTQASFTPWDGNAPVPSEYSFNIEHGPNGTPCPGASLPFKPSLTAGTTSNQAGGFSPFTMTMSRADGNQNLQAISLKMPSGLSGLLTGVELCPEPQASQGTCGPNSLIGETTVSVGVGGKPFSVKGGRVFMTGPYGGAPFGLSIVNPAKAGPYDLEKETPCDCVLVRAKIEVDPITSALTITTDNSGPYKIPTVLKGIPLEIQHVNVTINRPGFTFNPTNCNKLQITGTLHSTEGASSAVSLPLQATNCAVLGFKPQFSVSTSGKTSRSNGASLHVKLSYPKAPFGSQANIASVKVDLPKQLPSRLTTLQKACADSTFAANPASCPAASRIGTAKATTPLIPVPLTGPVFFVSHGGAKFPELIVVLQGYGVTVDLHSETFISKAGITSSTFRTIPDVPVGVFELNLPEGKYSALAANGNLCTSKLKMPTSFVAQNGAAIKQSTPITATGCAKKKGKKAKRSSRNHKKGK